MLRESKLCTKIIERKRMSKEKRDIPSAIGYKGRKKYFYICGDCGNAILQRLDTIKNMKWILCRNCSNKKRARDNIDKIRNATLMQMKEGNWHNISNLSGEKLLKAKEKYSKTMKEKYASGELEIWNKGKRGLGMPRYIEDRSLLKEPLNREIRTSIEIKNWRKRVLRRDRYTCQICHEKGGHKCAHHIKSFANIMNDNNIKSIDDARRCEELWNVSNGICLCEECHKWIHRLNPLNQQ